MDIIIGTGRKNAFVTIVERKELFIIVKLIESKHAEMTTDTLIRNMLPLKAKTHAITLDNGKEFTSPYFSWKRSINENIHGLLRRYFSRGTDFMILSKEEIQAIVDKLNHRPRKTPSYKTAYEL